ncbi:MAG: hypothetical protein ACTILB_13470 [Brevibacterium aurantiacum]
MTDGIEELGRRFGLGWLDSSEDTESEALDSSEEAPADVESAPDSSAVTDLARRFGLELRDDEAEAEAEAASQSHLDLTKGPPPSPAYQSPSEPRGGNQPTFVRTWDFAPDSLSRERAILMHKYIEKQPMAELLEALPGAWAADVAQTIVDVLSAARGVRLRDQPPSVVAEFVARNSTLVNQLFDRGESVDDIAARMNSAPQIVVWSLVVADRARDRVAGPVKATLKRRASRPR